MAAEPFDENKKLISSFVCILSLQQLTRQKGRQRGTPDIC